jgi:hypothetical protein
MPSEPPVPAAEARQSREDWLARVADADRRGEFLLSYDLATRALDQHPGDVALRHRAVLALARSGATEQARTQFRTRELAALTPSALAALGTPLAEDIPALGARIAKDLAFAAQGAARAARARVAAEQYERIFTRTGGYYPGINAATMWALAGDASRACSLATRVRAICETATPRSDDERYYLPATRAEAALVLRDVDAARAALAEAAGAGIRDYAAFAATRRQCALLCRSHGLDEAILDALAAPTVIHYTGHMIGRLDPAFELAVTQAIRDHLAERQAGIGYGALACGSDILFAEALLDRGAELNVVLPYPAERFIEASVRRGGREWIERFRRCRERATSFTTTSSEIELSDDCAIEYASAVAMGLAVTRARFLGAAVEQVAVWDGQPSPTPAPAGTEADMRRWAAAGHPAHTIACPPAGPVTASTPASAVRDSVRVVRAFLFGDVKGFSKLGESAIPVFLEHFLRPVAGDLRPFAEAILHRNTWGDGAFLVVRDVVSAARCALALQEAAHRIDREPVGLPPDLALRIGGHAGPVFELDDPILGQRGFFGSHVTRAARVEPVTPEGEVYVTEPFAALLALEPDTGLRCEYVGHMPSAKGYGDMRMYLLKRDATA